MKQNNLISKYLQIFPGRVFFDVASDGCGNGCFYCFTEHPFGKQKLLSFEEISFLCDEILKYNVEKDGVLSLCPNTEPLKSPESQELILYIISRLNTHFKHIQISTKSKLDAQLLAKIDKLGCYPKQIRISVSIPCIRNAEKLEPGAATVDDRWNNFPLINSCKNVSSTLYLRPFNSQMIDYANEYVKNINTYKPMHICLGAEFVKKVSYDEQLCTFMYDEKQTYDIFNRNDLNNVFAFASYIREHTHKQVFFSSMCNIFNDDKSYGCRLKLFEYNINYCSDCKRRD